MLTSISLLLVPFVIRSALAASTLQFFKDPNCGTSLGQINGASDGSCQKALGGGVGARLVTLDPNCTATIYTDSLCIANATVANVGKCLSGDAAVGSFKLECQAANGQAAFTTANGPPAPTATAAPTSSDPPASKETNAPASSNTSNSPALIGAIAAVSGLAVLMIPIAYLSWRCIRKRRERRHVLRLSDTNAFSHLPTPISSPQILFESGNTTPRSPAWKATIKSSSPRPNVLRKNTGPGNVSRDNLHADIMVREEIPLSNSIPLSNAIHPRNFLRNNSLPLSSIGLEKIPKRTLPRNSIPAATGTRHTAAESFASRSTAYRKTIPQDGLVISSDPFMGLTGRSKEIPMILDTTSDDDRFSLVSPLTPDAYLSSGGLSPHRTPQSKASSLERRPSSEALPWWQRPKEPRPSPGGTSYAELGGSHSSRAVLPRNFL